MTEKIVLWCTMCRKKLPRWFPPTTMFLLLIFGVLTVLLFYHYKTRYSYLYFTVENMFSGPKTVPILGNGLEFLNLDCEGTYKQFQNICNNYARFTRIWLGFSCYIVLYEAKDVKVSKLGQSMGDSFVNAVYCNRNTFHRLRSKSQALLSSNSQIKKSDVYRFLYDWIGAGLLTSYGEKWRSHRKIITPTFHYQILEQFLHIFNNNGSILIEKLSEHAGKGTFNVYKLINMYTLDNICETALGVKINAQKDSESEYARAVKDILSVISLRTLKIWLGFDFILNLTKYGAIYKKALKVLHKTTEDVIKTRKKELEALNSLSDLNNSAEHEQQKKRLAFLDLLILSGQMSDQDLREEVDTFMFEGHDTVTSGISFALYSLAHNPEIQEAAYREQLEIFGDSKRHPSWQDLQNMKYLDMVVKESLRLYPSVPLIARAIDDDLHLGDGYFLPKGSYCTVNVAKLHRDPKVWPNPDKFNPDNFLPEAVSARNPYSFIPFSAGPRNCIGQRFAMLEMRCCLSEILRNFKITPSRDHKNNVRVAGQLILFSNNGINIEIENRN